MCKGWTWGPQVSVIPAAVHSGWTQSPGVGFEAGQGEYAGMRVVTVRGHSLEFVLTNGDNKWDTPYGGGGKNYVANEPGVWRLKSGRVVRL